MKIVNLDSLETIEEIRPNFKGSHNIYNFKIGNSTYYFKEVPNR